MLGRAMAVPELRRMSVDVSVERFFSSICHPNRTPGRECEEARVDLERDILACAERSADSREHEMHLRFRQPEAGRDLTQIFVQPLRRDVQLDATVLPRDGKAGLRPERGLVLHAELVLAFDDDIRASVRIPMLDENVLDHVAL